MCINLIMVIMAVCLTGPQLFFEEQSFSLREAQRTLGQRVRLYLLRFILNVLVLSLLGGASYLIFISIEASQYEVRT